MITIRPLEKSDTLDMADILNALIEEGSTTALTTKVTPDGLWQKAMEGGTKAAWHVAIDDSGLVQGFQWIAPYPSLPPDAADIATFARIGKTGMGIGSKLFEASKAKAKDLGYTWINPNIRSDNISGLRYYSSVGFYDYEKIEAYQLGYGRIVDKTLKRYDLL